MQSILSFIRFIGGSDGAAWLAQEIVTGGVALALVALWRSHVAFELKAAALASATLLAMPYIYLYDMVVLSIPVALTLRIGMTTGFRTGELPALGCVAALLASFSIRCRAGRIGRYADRRDADCTPSLASSV